MTTFLERIIEDISRELNMSYKIISDGYITILKQNGKIKYVNEYLFGLNSEISSLLCNDKYAMYEVLSKYYIPVIEYKLIWHPGNQRTEVNKKLKELKDYFKDNYSHIVLKPNLGSGGINVFQIQNLNQIENTFLSLLNITNSIVANPFYAIKNEYRIIMLNGICRFIYKKELRESWQFNLSKGSIASKEIDVNLKKKLIDLAIKTNSVLQTKFVSIDIIEDTKNNLYILEVNSRVTMAKYIEQHPEDYIFVKDIYKDAILELFK